MRSSPPTINLLVLKAPDIDRAASFYQLLGISMERHQHGSGPSHYCTDLNGLVFEIYPGQSEGDSSGSTRVGFQVHDLDNTLQCLQKHGVNILRQKATSPWGFRAVVEDFAGHRVELIEKDKLPTERVKEFQRVPVASP